VSPSREMTSSGISFGPSADGSVARRARPSVTGNRTDVAQQGVWFARHYVRRVVSQIPGTAPGDNY